MRVNNVIFSKIISYVDSNDQETELELELEAEFVNGGIGSYEFWGATGYDSHPELDNLACTNLDSFSPEEQKYIENQISSGIFDDLAYEKYDEN